MWSEWLGRDVTLQELKGEAERVWIERSVKHSKRWRLSADVETVAHALKRFTDKAGGKTDLWYLTKHKRPFARWREVLPLLDTVRMRRAFLVYCLRRERAEQEIDMLLRCGKFLAFGDPSYPGAAPAWIKPLAWWDLKPDPEHPHAITSPQITYFDVRIVAAAEMAKESEHEPEEHADAREPAPVKVEQAAKTKRKASVDWRESDKLLVERIKAGMKDGTYRGADDGVKAVAGEAAGGAKLSSKIRRLHRRLEEES